MVSKVYMSSDRPNMGAQELAARSADLDYQLSKLGLAHWRTEGKWQGAFEAGFEVELPRSETFAYVAELLELARYYEQDAILFVATHGTAYLFHASGETEEIGHFAPVHPALVASQADYTRTRGGFYRVI